MFRRLASGRPAERAGGRAGGWVVTRFLRARDRAGAQFMAGKRMSSGGWNDRSLRAGGHLRRADASRTSGNPRTSGTSSRFHAKGFVAPVSLHAAAYTTSELTSAPKENDSTLASVPFARWRSKLKTGFNVWQSIDPLWMGWRFGRENEFSVLTCPNVRLWSVFGSCCRGGSKLW